MTIRTDGTVKTVRIRTDKTDKTDRTSRIKTDKTVRTDRIKTDKTVRTFVRDHLNGPNRPIRPIRPYLPLSPRAKKIWSHANGSIFIIYRYRLLDNYQWLISLNGVALSYQQAENLTCEV